MTDRIENAIKLLEEVVADLKQLNQVSDEEKARIGMLVWNDPDLWRRDPEQYALMAPYANEAYPPFNEDTWALTGMMGRDMRPSYDVIERMKRGDFSGRPSDRLVKP